MKRRDFLKTAAATALSVQIVPRHVLGGPGNTPPSEKLNMASVGVGGMGECGYGMRLPPGRSTWSPSAT